MSSTNPSKDNHWLFLFVIFAILSAAWTIYNSYHFICAAAKTWNLKIPLMISLTFLYCSACGVFHVYYSRWAKKTTNLLIQLLAVDPQLVYFRYNRFFIDEERIKRLGYERSSFKRLSQRDIRRAVAIAENAKKSFIYSQET